MRKASITAAILCLGAAVFVLRCLKAVDGGPSGWRALIDFPALLTTALAVLVSVWVLRMRWREGWLSVGVGCLVAVPAVCLMEWLALAGNPAFEAAGPWLRTTLLGILYPALCCAAFALAEFVTWRFPGEMVFQEPSGARLPASFNPLVWRQMIR